MRIERCFLYVSNESKFYTKNIVKVADILLAAELENEMAEMAEGEGDDEQDFEDEMADVFYSCFCYSYVVIISCYKHLPLVID